jgi:hypothetical protein
MGLARPGESAEFCAICGVCHAGTEHAPTLRPGEFMSDPTNAAAVRDLVAQVVHQTLGNAD